MPDHRPTIFELGEQSYAIPPKSLEPKTINKMVSVLSDARYYVAMGVESMPIITETGMAIKNPETDIHLADLRNDLKQLCRNVKVLGWPLLFADTLVLVRKTWVSRAEDICQSRFSMLFGPIGSCNRDDLLEVMTTHGLTPLEGSRGTIFICSRNANEALVVYKFLQWLGRTRGIFGEVM